MNWVDPDTSAWVRHPASDADWNAIVTRYGEEFDSPLGRVISVARSHRTLTVIEENRYVDPDYRSEYSAFWSKRFADVPAFARRLHFFRKRIGLGELLGSSRDPGYVGYTTLRPVSPGRVGRTMIAPPARLNKAVLALATDRLSLFGRGLEVTGAPFSEQDGEYLRCAHAAAWMCHYNAYLRRLVGRTFTADLVDLSPSSLTFERALPSKGLTLNQLQAILAATGQPAMFFGLSNMPIVEGVENPLPKSDPNGRELHPGLWDTRLFSVICRYLNAGFPVLVGTLDHAFVIVGWFREKGRIRFVRCDDQWGPYETVNSPFTDRYRPWYSLMVPLPPKVFLSGEVSESTGHFLVRAYAGATGAPKEWKDLAARLLTGEISIRTFLRSNHEFKRSVANQRRNPDVRDALRLARLSHFVWVVEAHDRSEREVNRESVLAEFVFDSTSSDDKPALSAFSLPGATVVNPPSGGARVVIASGVGPWGSHLSNS